MLARIEQLMAGLREVSDNIAHDLKTPLNRLRNRVEAALREPYGEPVYREALERTIEEADGLIKTFNALLSIARIEAGARRREPRDARRVGAAARRGGTLRAGRRGARAGAEGRYAGADLIRGDRQLLGQAIANLIDNAIKYGTPRGCRGRHRCPARSRGECRGQRTDGGDRRDRPRAWRARSDRERVLDRFVRLEASRSEPGSGLGLSLVAAVARLHGGSLRLEDNEPGLTRHPRLARPMARRMSTGRRGKRSREQRSGRRDGVLRAHHRSPARLRRGTGRRRARSLTEALPGLPISPLRPSCSARRQSFARCSPRPSPARPISPRWRCEIPRCSPNACCAIPTRIWPKRAPSLPPPLPRPRPPRRPWRCCGASSAASRCLTGLADLGGVWPTEATLARHERRRRRGAASRRPRFCSARRATPGRSRRRCRRGRRRPATSSSPWASSARSSSTIRATSTSSSSTTPSAPGSRPDVEPSTFFVRLTRELVRLLQEHTADGYVFRTDLRLRPDPGATQIALSDRRGPDLLRELRPELGARGPDQGARRRRRCRGGRGVPAPAVALRLAQISRLRGDRRHPRDEAADPCLQGSRRHRGRRATTSSSAAAASARSSSSRRPSS